MRLAFASYPIAFQMQGGVAIKMQETIAALARLDVDVRLFDARYEKLVDFDLVHVFAASHGNHVLVEAVKNLGVPVVLSPILHPPFSKWRALTSDFCDRLTGRLTGWTVRTSYGQIRSALGGADRIVVLGRSEWQIVAHRYGIDSDKIRVVPNGISSGYFSADPKPFFEKHGLNRKIVLCVAYISPYKNQLGLIKALQNESCDIVLIGECRPNVRAYLDQCLSLGGQRLHYLGAIDHDDPMLASAYAAADVMVLASRTEVAPNAVLESLAAGTPVVVTKNHSLDLETDGDILVPVNPDDPVEIRDRVLKLLDRPPDRDRCTATVEGLTWDTVAKKLLEVYMDAIGKPGVLH